jgi:hypothetical protein
MDLIKTGDILIWRRDFMGVTYEVQVTSVGLMHSDGSLFRTPTEAAKFFNGNSPVNGWLVWKTKSSGRSLDSLWKRTK